MLCEVLGSSRRGFLKVVLIKNTPYAGMGKLFALLWRDPIDCLSRSERYINASGFPRRQVCHRQRVGEELDRLVVELMDHNTTCCKKKSIGMAFASTRQTRWSARSIAGLPIVTTYPQRRAILFFLVYDG